MFVHPEWRGVGIFQDLFALMLQVAESCHPGSLRLETHPESPKVIGYCATHLGSECVGNYEPTVTSCPSYRVLLCKRLNSVLVQ